MSTILTGLAAARREGRPYGIASVCSAHPVVLRAALRRAAGSGKRQSRPHRGDLQRGQPDARRWHGRGTSQARTCHGVPALRAASAYVDAQQYRHFR